MAIYVALVSDEEIFDPAVHSREDLTVFHVRKRQEEGDVAELTLEVLNTRAAYPDRRVFVSEDGALIFVGYITSNLGQLGETVTVQAISKPLDAAERQDALCQSLKVAPFYDELAIPEEQRDNIAEVLAGHSKVLDWNPVSGDVIAVDVIGAEVADLALEPFDGSVAASFIDPPASIEVSATARWSQVVLQEHDLSRHTDGIRTMTAKGLVSQWPKVGEELASDMVVLESMAREKVDAFGTPVREAVEVMLTKTAEDFQLDPFLDDENEIAEKGLISTLETGLVVQHSYEVRRSEKTTFSVSRPLQNGLKLGAAEEIEITMQELKPEDGPLIPDWAQGVEYADGDVIEWSGRVWRSIRDHVSGSQFEEKYWRGQGLPASMNVRLARSFFLNDRGKAFANYMLERAKSRLSHTGRCVRVSCDAEMPLDASSISTDKTVEIQSPGLIGGSAIGKVVDYVLEWENGDRFMSITIASTPGTTATDTLSLSEPAASIPSEFGRVDVEVSNLADEQLVEFMVTRRPKPPKLANDEDVAPPRFTTETAEQDLVTGRISPTRIKYSPVTPRTDLVGSSTFNLEGEFGLPSGYTVQ